MNVHLVRPLSQITPPITLVLTAAPALYTMVGRMTDNKSEMANQSNWINVMSVLNDVGNAMKDKNLIEDFKAVCDATIMTPDVVEAARGPRVRVFAKAPMRSGLSYSTTVRLRRMSFMEMSVEVEEAPESDIVTQIGGLRPFLSAGPPLVVDCPQCGAPASERCRPGCPGGT